MSLVRIDHNLTYIEQYLQFKIISPFLHLSNVTAHIVKGNRQCS